MPAKQFSSHRITKVEDTPITNTKMSGTDLKPKGRQRASTPRSKTGCITCKMRRLKCGEEKPGCLRCAKSGWHCDGYEQGPSSASQSRTPSPGMSIYAPASSLNLDENERKYFQVYIEQRTTSLDRRDTESYAWHRTVLQECQSNPCVRHVIVAQGALAQSQTRRDQWAYLRNIHIQSPHHEFALMQYEKALRRLRTSIGELQNGKGARTTLIASLALTLFDCFCGNGGFATQHIRFGRRLLNAWRLSVSEAANQLMPPQIPPDSIDEGLAEMFIRLDIQSLCAMGIDPDCDYDHTLSLDSPHIPVPLEFSNLEEARHARLQLLNDGYKFWLRTLKYNFLPATQVPEKMFHARDYWLEQIRLWNSALDPVLLNYALDSQIHPLARPDAPRLKTAVLTIRLNGTLHASEMAYDYLFPQFEYLFSIAQDVMEYERTHSDLGAATGMNPAWLDPSLGMGEQQLQGNLRTADVESYCWEDRIVPPLYLIATKCRVHHLRHAAIALLLSERRREGIWDSILCGKVAEWMVGLEEEGVRIGSDGQDWYGGKGKGLLDEEELFIPEERRCWGETTERDLQGRRAVVKCKQNIPMEEGGGWRERVTTVSW